MSSDREPHPVARITPREFRPEIVQEYIDERGEAAARAARIEAERCALVEVIERMTLAGMDAREITRRLSTVHTTTIPEVKKTTVAWVRQLLTGTKGQRQVPRQIRRNDE